MARQAWNRGMEPDRVVLEHIRALLLALAALVDRAAGLPTVERLRFLAVMASGEAEARRLIVAMASDPSPAETAASRPAADLCPSAPATAVVDAAVLAARFRMLALAVDALLAQTAAEPPYQHTFQSINLPRHNPRLISQNTPSPALRATSPPLNGAEESQRRRRCSSRERAKGGPVAIGVRGPAAMAIGAPLPQAGGEVPSGARR